MSCRFASSCKLYDSTSYICGNNVEACFWCPYYKQKILLIADKKVNLNKGLVW